MSDFTHLHCHTEYSLLDGGIRIKDLCNQAVDFGFSSAAITDHGNLFGAMVFYQTAKKCGIKPIIGCEMYVTPGDMREKDTKTRYHLLLLAQNNQGYKNLVKLVSDSFLEGFYYKPRVDKAALRAHSEGLIASSACLQGEVSYALRHNEMDKALEIAREYAAIYPDRFYLELMVNGFKEQEVVNERMKELAETTGLPLLATNDCHYLYQEDAEAHDILLCVGTGKLASDTKRLKFDTDALYYKPLEVMEQEFKDCPQALDNAARIVDSCHLDLTLNQHYFPVYDVPQGRTLDEEFTTLSRQGLQERLDQLPYEVDEAAYHARMDQELAVIIEKGFPAYFLIVQDFINWAKGKGIPVGPGRGSAAGSIVAWSLKITDLDPIKYHLFFERFLNVERESMPDIDVDFCYNRREEVIRYVTEKYGKDHVAQIVAMGTMKAKGVIRDVGRVLDIPLKEVDKIAKLIPDDLGMTLDKALKQEPELGKLMQADARVDKLIAISKRLEGLARHASTHAAGLVISQKPMTEYLPLFKGKKGEVITQFDKKKVEVAGLIKFDFLGLKTLTVIHDALTLIKHNNKPVPDVERLPLDDPLTYELLSKGESDGVFQLESSGMKNVLRSMRPSCFEDIIALLALYRPGPLESGMVELFVRRKHGEEKVEYPYPSLEPVLQPILEDTYGVILYQEQVMKIASDLGNYSLGEGDILRRAMGKKDPDVMAKQRSRFLQGTRENHIPDEAAEYIFDLMEKFAGYGFNKSHSAAYALISYQTAYLKAHFPAEFMAATITSEVNNTDKVMAHVNACREMDIPVLPPQINKSDNGFTVEGEHVRFGLSGIKGVGASAVQSIVKEREEGGSFTSLLDFCQRVNMRRVNKKVIESLAKSGALDILGCTRRSVMHGMERVMAMAQRTSKAKTGGQLSFMSMVSDTTCSLTGLGLDIEEAGLAEYPDEEKFQMEKEAFGFYLLGHPLAPYREEIRRHGYDTLEQLKDTPPGYEARVAVIVTAKKEILTKKGDKMAFCQVEDLTGTGEIIVFPEIFQASRDELNREEPMLLQGVVIADDRDTSKSEEQSILKLRAVALKSLTTAVKEGNAAATILVTHPKAEVPTFIRGLKDLLARYPGENPVHLSLEHNGFVCTLRLGPAYQVSTGPVFWKDVEAWKAGVCGHSPQPHA
ncbi:MAG: DNA polymerase III subunit alpha [Deltaproteobacteria bacterium]|nr:MAG: DNA polymerase III subunit alpha [Deltaproteobacteria bacterium]